MKEIPASPQHVICQSLTIIQCLIKYVTFYDQFPYTNSKYITYFMTLYPGSKRFSFSAHNLKKKVMRALVDKGRQMPTQGSIREQN